MGTSCPWERFRQAPFPSDQIFEALESLVSTSQTPVQATDVEKLVSTLGDDSIQGHHVQNVLILISRWTRRVVMRGYSPSESEIALRLTNQCTEIIFSKGQADIRSCLSSWLFRCLAEASVLLTRVEDKERVWMALVRLLGHEHADTIVCASEWWPNVCSGVLYCISFSLKEVKMYREWVSWLLTMMLSCSSGIQLNNMSILVSLFTSTSSAFLEPCHRLISQEDVNTIRTWYGLLRSARVGLQQEEENNQPSWCSPVILVACYAAMLDTIASHPNLLSEFSAILDDIMGICRWGRLHKSFEAVSSSSLALSHMHKKSRIPCDITVILSLLETYTSVVSDVGMKAYQRGLRDACLYALHDSVSLGGVQTLQLPILESLQSLTQRFYNLQYESFNRTKTIELQAGNDLFEFAIHVIDIVTKQTSVLIPTSLGKVVQSIGYLQLWRTSNIRVYRTILQSTMEALPTQPQDATDVATSLFKDGFNKSLRNPVILARLQFSITLLRPCSEILAAPLLANQLVDACLVLLGADHPPLVEASNEFLCGALSQERLNGQEKRRISILFIQRSFEVLMANIKEEHMDTWRSRFTRGVSILASTSDTEYQCVFLEKTLDGCSTLVDESLYHAVPVAFESAAYFLHHMSLENIPNACRQLHGFLSRLDRPECHIECCNRLLGVIQESHDITRVPYLAQHYMEITARGLTYT